jgi:hypothetical protein
MSEANKKPALPGKKRWRPEKNGGVDARDQRAVHDEEQMKKPAPGLRQIRGIAREGHLCKG